MKKFIYACIFMCSIVFSMVACEAESLNETDEEIFQVDKDSITRPGQQGGNS